MDSSVKMKYETDFKNKVCLVTGATSGIGKSVTAKLLEAGKTLIKSRCSCYNDWKNSYKA